jgi:hypothetical protein
MRARLPIRGVLATVSLILSLGLAAPAHATSIAPRINYQGFLTSAGGVPTNATLAFNFALFSASSGGAPLWSEGQTLPVANGIYNVSLGASTPLALPALPFDAPYYLEVTVNGEVLSPRQPLASAPYAFRAGCIPGDRVTCYPPAAR